MSEEMKKGILDKEYSRRQFLKMSGKGLAGISMTAAMLSLFGCTQKEIDEEVVTVVATPTSLLVANRAKCTGCQRCETNCTLTNDGKAQPWLSRLHARDYVLFGTNEVPADYAHAGGFFGEWSMAPETCKQCKEPKCMEVCPVQAIAPDPNTGARVVDKSKCIGCGACVGTCPWHMPKVDPDTQKSTKCITCGACAAGCPTGALTVIPWEDVVAAAQQ